MENRREYLIAALESGHSVEVDVWWRNGSFYLGHDAGVELAAPSFLVREQVWCHAKSPNALYALLQINAHCFFHDRDAATLTSRGFIWSFPSSTPTPKSVCVLPEVFKGDPTPFAAICTDFVHRYSHG